MYGQVSVMIPSFYNTAGWALDWLSYLCCLVAFLFIGSREDLFLLYTESYQSLIITLGAVDTKNVDPAEARTWDFRDQSPKLYPCLSPLHRHMVSYPQTTIPLR